MMTSNFDSIEEGEDRNGSVDIEELYEELKTRAQDEGVGDKEGWVTLVEDMLQIKLENGEIMQDDHMQLLETLNDRFSAYQMEAGI